MNKWLRFLKPAPSSMNDAERRRIFGPLHGLDCGCNNCNSLQRST